MSESKIDREAIQQLEFIRLQIAILKEQEQEILQTLEINRKRRMAVPWELQQPHNQLVATRQQHRRRP